MGIKVVVVGDFLAELTLQTTKLPRPHQTVPAHQFVAGGTGRGTIQAVTAARLGADVTFIGRVGTDLNAKLAFDMFKSEGINTDYLIEDAKHPTGVKVTFAETVKRTMSGETQGANAAVKPADVDRARNAIQAADVLITQLAIPLETVHYALQLAKTHQVKAILKPTPFQPVPVDMLMLPDIFTPNQEELRELAIQTDQNEMPTGQITVCTLGRQGAQWFRRLPDKTLETDRVGGFSVRTVDDTGAGDVFSAALGVALAEGKALAEAIRFANAAAALSTTQNGTVNSIPRRDKVDILSKANN